MVAKTKKSVSAKIAFWIMMGMIGGVAAGIAHGFLYPARVGTTIVVIAVFGVGTALAYARYLLQRYRERRVDDANGFDDAEDAAE